MKRLIFGLLLLGLLVMVGVVIAQYTKCTTNCEGDGSPRYTCWLEQVYFPGTNSSVEGCKCVLCYNVESWACPKFC